VTPVVSAQEIDENQRLNGICGDELVHNSGEFFGFVFLKEVSTTSDDDVWLALSSRHVPFKHLLSATSDGVAVSERSEEWLVPRTKNIPGLLIGDV
jgi:hypothetical protein